MNNEHGSRQETSLLASEYEKGQEEQSLPMPPDPSEKQPTLTLPRVGGQQKPITSPPASTPQSQSDIPRLRGQKKNRLARIGTVLVIAGLLGVAVLYVFLEVLGPNVTVYQVGVQNVTQGIGGGGIIFPRQQVDISYPITERAVSVLVKPGDQVTPNQPLIQLDPTQLTIAVKMASDDLAAAQAYLASVSAGGNSALIAQAQKSYNLAKSKYDALVAQASSSLQHHGFLISPMKGVVTSVDINPGQVFPADASLLTIMDESTVIVHTKIPLSDIQQVHLGQPAIVTPSALPNLTFNGTVSAIVPRADPQTDTFEVWVSVVNANGTLLPGMSAFVRIAGTGQALVVPRLAVLNPDNESVVFVVRDDHAYLEHVHIVGRSTDSIYIDEGLSAGDKVVLIGLNSLRNGQRIHVTRVERQVS